MLSIWTWAEAPAEMTALSRHGGDEDWLLVCSAAHSAKYWPSWLADAISGSEDSYVVGFGHVDRHVLDDGTIVVIFAHG